MNVVAKLLNDEPFIVAALSICRNSGITSNFVLLLNVKETPSSMKRLYEAPPPFLKVTAALLGCVLFGAVKVSVVVPDGVVRN
jgi:hypothetical protein